MINDAEFNQIDLEKNFNEIISIMNEKLDNFEFFEFYNKLLKCICNKNSNELYDKIRIHKLNKLKSIVNEINDSDFFELNFIIDDYILNKNTCLYVEKIHPLKIKTSVVCKMLENRHCDNNFYKYCCLSEIFEYLTWSGNTFNNIKRCIYFYWNAHFSFNLYKSNKKVLILSEDIYFSNEKEEIIHVLNN